MQELKPINVAAFMKSIMGRASYDVPNPRRIYQDVPNNSINYTSRANYASYKTFRGYSI